MKLNDLAMGSRLQLINKIDRLFNIKKAIEKQEDDYVLNVLWRAYHDMLNEIVEFVGTQWCESVKEVAQ